MAGIWGNLYTIHLLPKYFVRGENNNCGATKMKCRNWCSKEDNFALPKSI